MDKEEQIKTMVEDMTENCYSIHGNERLYAKALVDKGYRKGGLCKSEDFTQKEISILTAMFDRGLQCCDEDVVYNLINKLGLVDVVIR